MLSAPVSTKTYLRTIKKTAAIYSLRLRYGFLTFAVINSVNVFLCQALLNFIFIIYLTSIFPELRSAVGPEYFRIFFRLFFEKIAVVKV